MPELTKSVSWSKDLVVGPTGTGLTHVLSGPTQSQSHTDPEARSDAYTDMDVEIDSATSKTPPTEILRSFQQALSDWQGAAIKSIKSYRSAIEKIAAGDPWSQVEQSYLSSSPGSSALGDDIEASTLHLEELRNRVLDFAEQYAKTGYLGGKRSKRREAALLGLADLRDYATSLAQARGAYVIEPRSLQTRLDHFDSSGGGTDNLLGSVRGIHSLTALSNRQNRFEGKRIRGGWARDPRAFVASNPKLAEDLPNLSELRIKSVDLGLSAADQARIAASRELYNDEERAGLERLDKVNDTELRRQNNLTVSNTWHRYQFGTSDFSPIEPQQIISEWSGQAKAANTKYESDSHSVEAERDRQKQMAVYKAGWRRLNDPEIMLDLMLAECKRQIGRPYRSKINARPQQYTSLPEMSVDERRPLLHPEHGHGEEGSDGCACCLPAVGTPNDDVYF